MRRELLALVITGVFLLSFLGSASAFSLRELGEAIQQKYQEIKQKYLNASNFYQEVRQKWLQARETYQQIKNETNREEALEWARKVAGAGINITITYLEKVIAKVNATTALTEEQRSAIISELQLRIEWLRNRSQEIPQANLSEISNITHKIRNYWQNHRVAVKRHVGKILSVKINWLIQKIENLTERAEAKIEELKANGTNTSELEALLDDLNEKLDLAKEKYEAAKEKFENITTLEEADQLFREGRDFIREAHQYLVQAFQQFKQLVKEIKEVLAG